MKKNVSSPSLPIQLFLTIRPLYHRARLNKSHQKYAGSPQRVQDCAGSLDFGGSPPTDFEGSHSHKLGRVCWVLPWGQSMHDCPPTVANYVGVLPSGQSPAIGQECRTVSIKIVEGHPAKRQILIVCLSCPK